MEKYPLVKTDKQKQCDANIKLFQRLEKETSNLSYEANKSSTPNLNKYGAHAHYRPVSPMNAKILNKTLAIRIKQPIKRSKTKWSLLKECNNGSILVSLLMSFSH